MHGLRDLSFWLTKKKPTPVGDEDGQVIPAYREDWMYSLIALVSGGDKE